MDKAGKGYWNRTWETARLPRAADPRARGPRGYIKRNLHAYFRQAFSSMKTSGKVLLEIGCAQSIWLPYFAQEFGFTVCGLDYSEIGCAQERQILSSAGVAGEVVCSDFFSPPERLLGAFDVVVSLGVAEHFQDTAACIAAFTKFLKPGGLLMTHVPNLTGLIGFIQKRINRPVYDVHVPLDSATLRAAHAAAGLEVLSCDYFLFTNFGVCNLNGLPAGSVTWWMKKFLLTSLTLGSVSAWLMEEAVGFAFKPNKVTSPYINCLARKPFV